MWTSRYWSPRYWASRYWARGSHLPPPPLARRNGWARNILTGAPAGLAEVAVRAHATNTLVPLYGADGVTLQVNPITADATTGRYFWLAPNGRYDEYVTPVEGEGLPYANPDILLYNPDS